MSPRPKHTHGQVHGVVRPTLLKVMSPAEAAAGAFADQSVLLWDEQTGEGGCGPITVSALRDPTVIGLGDVVRLRPDSGQVAILYRRGSRGNVLFTTERCNSLCLMCSQPPREVDDGWRISELLQLVSLIDREEPQLGITGGEPTLLGEGLSDLLAHCADQLPHTRLHVLTNGRNFRHASLARTLVDAGGDRTTWAVPLAGDYPELHDEIMGAPGGWAETLEGLAQLAALGARVEIRVVVHALSAPRLPQLARFIYRRLPFVEHVALMGLEPMGLAKGNRERLWIDPADLEPSLSAAVGHLDDRGMSVSIYNMPLCVLPSSLRPFARQSISDWKNAFAPECETCTAKASCAGFFSSAGPAWRSRRLRPLMKDALDEVA